MNVVNLEVLVEKHILVGVIESVCGEDYLGVCSMLFEDLNDNTSLDVIIKKGLMDISWSNADAKVTVLTFRGSHELEMQANIMHTLWKICFAKQEVEKSDMDEIDKLIGEDI